MLPCFGLGALPAPFDWALFLGALGLAGAAIARAWDRWIAVGLIGILLLLGIFDQMRWQPWAYQYMLCLAPMAFVGRSDDRAGMLAGLDCVRLILIAIYVWSGIHKFGVQFQRTYQSDVVVQWLEATSGWLRELILFSGKVVPWMEIAIGACLLLPRTRTIGVLVAAGMHASILLAMGPFGLGTNSVIWPWNVAMPCIVVVLFWRHRGFALVSIFSVKRLIPLAVCLAVLVVVMPSRTYSGKWDQYLGFHLYSGHHQRMALILENRRAAEMEDFFSPMMRPTAAASGQESQHQELPFAVWAVQELNVPIPSEDRLLLGVAKQLVEEFELGAACFFYRDYPELLLERGYAMYSPVKIKGMSRLPPLKQQGAPYRQGTSR